MGMESEWAMYGVPVQCSGSAESDSAMTLRARRTAN